MDSTRAPWCRVSYRTWTRSPFWGQGPEPSNSTLFSSLPSPRRSREPPMARQGASPAAPNHNTFRVIRWPCCKLVNAAVPVTCGRQLPHVLLCCRIESLLKLSPSSFTWEGMASRLHRLLARSHLGYAQDPQQANQKPCLAKMCRSTTRDVALICQLLPTTLHVLGRTAAE